MKTLFLILLFLGCINLDQEEYEVLTIIQNPENREIADYPKLNDKDLFIEGTDINSLRKNVSLFYKKYWMTSKGKRKYNSNSSMNKINEIIKTPENDLELELFSNEIALITRTESGFSSDDLVRVQDVWHLSEKKWKPILNHTNHFYKVNLEYLNNDEFIDIIFEGGCCDNEKFSIFLGNSKNNFRYIQEITVRGISDIYFSGKCNNQIKMRHFQNFLHSKSAIFDCKENRFKELKFLGRTKRYFSL